MMQEEEAYTLDDLLNKAKTYIKNEEDISLIKRAYQFASKAHAGQTRLTGDDYILHPLNVAMILTGIYADSQTLATALLHQVVNFSYVSIEEVEKDIPNEQHIQEAYSAARVAFCCDEALRKDSFVDVDPEL